MLPTEEFAQTFPFLGSADPAFLQELNSITRITVLPPGTRVYHPGDPCAALAFVLEGCIRVFLAGESGREISLYRIERAQTCILSTSAILGSSAFPAFAEVESETRAILIPATLVQSWMETHAIWRSFLFGLLTNRLGSVLLSLEEVAFQRLDIRLAQLLVELAHGGLEIRNTHQELAAELGTAREVVSRVLRDFENKGWIKRSRGGLAIVNSQALEALG